jgi:Spy/CpxP family protein refolding chaperone
MIRHPKPLMALAALALVLALAQTSLAQQQGRGRGFGRGFSVSQPQLATLEQVQTELKVTAEQKSKITEVNETLSSKRRELFQDSNRENFAERREQLDKANAEATEQLGAALDETQQNRLRELWIQVNGTGVLDEEPIAKELKLTEQQQTQIEQARDDAREAMRAAFQNAGDQSDEQRRERFLELRRESEQKVLALLTAEQREQFEKMQGKKIEIDTRQLFQRRRDT